MSKNLESPLVSAARTLSEGLATFEALSEELSRAVINSDKSLQRARRGLQDCAAHSVQLAESLQSFADAMQRMQAAQERCLQLTAAATERVRQRQEQRARVEERLAELVARAREVGAPALELPAGETSSSALLASLQEVMRRLDALIADAGEVAALARDDEWADLERDTRSLEQQLLATRNRAKLSLSKLAQGAPS